MLLWRTLSFSCGQSSQWYSSHLTPLLVVCASWSNVTLYMYQFPALLSLYIVVGLNLSSKESDALCALAKGLKRWWWWWWLLLRLRGFGENVRPFIPRLRIFFFSAFFFFFLKWT